jgi:hypothetical protein
MKKERVTTWFVEPMDAKTNESAMMDLVQSCGATDDKIYRDKLDNEGVPHDVVEVPYRFIVRMECNAAKFEHKFRIFTHVEGESAMRLWPFGNHKKLCRSAEVKRVTKKIAELPKRPTAKT